MQDSEIADIAAAVAADVVDDCGGLGIDEQRDVVRRLMGGNRAGYPGQTAYEAGVKLNLLTSWQNDSIEERLTSETYPLPKKFSDLDPAHAGKLVLFERVAMAVVRALRCEDRGDANES